VTGIAAIVVSGMAALFFGVGIVLLPAALPAGGMLRPLALVAATVPVIFLLARSVPPLAAVARVVTALWPLLAVTLLLPGMQPARLDYLRALGIWPFVAAMLAAGLSLLPTQAARQDPVPTLALFPFGAVLATCAAALLVIGFPTPLRLVLSTPYHVVIFLAAATRLPPAREKLIRALIAMMPLLGFLGTIAGLLEALTSLPALFSPTGADSGALGLVMRGLATAFETTLVGLVGAALTGFLLLLLTDREATGR
jgi:hypothetical protein